MKHQRTPTIIEDISDDESVCKASQGPLRKRPKRSTAVSSLTLESLIRAGEVLKQADFKYNDEAPRRSGRVTPTKDHHKREEEEEEEQDCSKLVQTALSDTLAVMEDKKSFTHIPHSLPALKTSDWKKYCRPLAAPPRLPNVPFGYSVQESNKRAIPI